MKLPILLRVWWDGIRTAKKKINLYKLSMQHSGMPCDNDVQFNTYACIQNSQIALCSVNGRNSLQEISWYESPNVLVILCDLPAKTCMTPDEVGSCISVMSTIRVAVTAMMSSNSSSLWKWNQFTKQPLFISSVIGYYQARQSSLPLT